MGNKVHDGKAKESGGVHSGGYHRVPTGPWNPWKFVNQEKEIQGPGKFYKINAHIYRSLKVLEFILW